ncbi:DNA polymerase I [Chrysiogenes arsenatis]|uniref:DNA polymerase I n=1 Tax=Chrysiogenes arsenatis TaxID=309797 RepID=UPI000556C399|nr:DNA polymerase I [Chrysiogenes arsenatis]
MKKLLLVDGSSFIYKAFYGLMRLSTRQGFPTHAIYGFRNILEKCVATLQPDAVLVVFDTPAPTFRHELYAEYKANRQKAPEDLVVQIPHIKKMVPALGYALLEKDGFEADDLLGTIAVHRQQWGYDVVVIATSDKDLGQVVSHGVHLYDTSKEKLLNADGVTEKMGVPPERVRDLLALMGDSSDNVPGVPGIGPKTALKLLSEYHTLDNLLDHADTVKGAVGEKLRHSRELAHVSRELVTIQCDVPLQAGDVPMAIRKPDVAALRGLYQELEFHALVDALPAEIQSEESLFAPSHLEAKSDVLSHYQRHIVSDASQFAALLRQLAEVEVLALDTETTSTDPLTAALVGVSLAASDQSWYLPFAHTAPDSQNLSHTCLEQLLKALDRTCLTIVGQNLKFDLNVLRTAEVPIPVLPQYFDTMIASYLLDANRRAHGLDQLAAEFLGHTMIAFADVVESGETFADVPIDSAAEYSCEDACATLELHRHFAPQLHSLGLQKLFDEIEMPLMHVLAEMERVGIALDVEQLRLTGDHLSRRLYEIEETIFTLAEENFNVNSPKQVGAILFEKMGIPPRKKTRTGYSTDVSVLEELAGEYEIVRYLLQHRTISKLLGTYVNTLGTMVNPQTGRIHTSFNQTITNTGRLSSSDPNLQNIPIRTAEGREIRKAFVAAPGYCFVSADYSQIELRIAAHMANDPTMIAAFCDGRDIHAETAALIFGRADDETRRMAKAVNFGILYGISPFKLAGDLHISRAEAKALIESYFLRYPNVREYVASQIDFARTHGYVSTLFGRRRELTDINSRNRNIAEAAERNAVNMPIQGTAADIIKIAMNTIAPKLPAYGARMVLQIHDELLFEVPLAVKDEVEKLIRYEMEHCVEFRVPLTVDVACGASWYEV